MMNGLAVEFDNVDPENKCVCDLKSTELRAVYVFYLNLPVHSVQTCHGIKKNMSVLVHFHVICRALMALKYFKVHNKNQYKQM